MKNHQGSDFRVFRNGSWKVWIREERVSKLCPPDRSLLSRDKDTRIIQDNDRSAVFSIPFHEALGGSVVLKLYPPPKKARKILIDLLRRSSAVREFKISVDLFNQGLPIPEPLAAGERRRYRFLRESFFISRELFDTERIDLYLASLNRRPPQEQLKSKRAVSRLTARALAHMHRASIYHRDLHCSNVLVEKGSPPQAVYLIDFKTARVARLFNHGRFIHDLKRLGRSAQHRQLKERGLITRRDILRFYSDYVREMCLSMKETDQHECRPRSQALLNKRWSRALRGLS
ncbi:MAG: phosphotransferase [Candidatus Tectomicrobia bacterium]|nr:phosphotransferase [Candidatus Tectomicrobia bacterium]